MKIVEVKIFNTSADYFVIVEKIKYNNNFKIIEQEYSRKIESTNEIQYYLTNILNTIDFRKNKIFINYISNDVLIETLNSNDLKFNLNKELNMIYPNYHLDYNLFTGEIKMNSKNKKIVCALVKIEVINKIKTFISFVGKKEIYFGLDILMLQCFINKNISLFSKKYILLIQKNYIFYRFYQILNGKIVNYLILDEESNEFKNIYKSVINKIDGKVDEVIFEGDYKTYHMLIVQLFNVNIHYIDYNDKLKNLDERKLIYGKNKI